MPLTYTEADFERLCWHNCHSWSVTVRSGDREPSGRMMTRLVRMPPPGSLMTPSGRGVLVAIAVVALMTVVTVPNAVAQVQLLPADEAATRPDFFSFRAQLQRDIARHDVEALLSVVAPDIKASFGGDDGVDDFRRMWRLGEADSRVWEELGAVLALGGTFTGPETFVAPYTFSRWPDDLDAFEHVAVIGANVRLRAAPKTDAPTIRTVSFVVLPVARAAAAPGDEGWQAVQLASGAVVYVASRFVRSPIGYRATFVFRGRWQLVSFLAGD